MPHPHEFPRRVLLCVTGLSPQVVTEALFALVTQPGDGFPPTEVHVLTTTVGADLVQRQLLGPRGKVAELKSEQPSLAQTVFGPEQVHVLEREGKPLADIVTGEDNQAVANGIVSLVQSFAVDGDCAIHACIAGGRKSMGFFLGYAMSLVGRAQDRVSHVLVSPPFEGHSDFFFPSREPRMISTADGRSVCTDQAVVSLAPIPIVLLADGLHSGLDAGRTFEELVNLRQLSNGPVEVVVRPGRQAIVVNGVTIDLPVTDIAWYTFFAMLRLAAGVAKLPRPRDPGLIHLPKSATGSQAIDEVLLRRAFARVPDADLPDLARVDQDFMRAKLSEMRRRLEHKLGVHGTRRIAVLGPGDFSLRDARYGVMLGPGELRIE